MGGNKVLIADKMKNDPENNNLFLTLNRTIMDAAVRGKSDCYTGWISLYWIIVKSYVFTYVEDLQAQASSFRIFNCDDISLLHKHALLFPDYTDDVFVCLYDSSERADTREVLYCKDLSAWYGNALQAASSVTDGID